MSNKGKWNRWYQDLREAQAYGDTVTYEMGGEFLRDCELVEDWGCGKGWFKKFIPEGRYRGIDGSQTPFADEIVDLVSYSSNVPGIYMRHVLEHNYQWIFILNNALRSFTSRMVLVLFTPLSGTTQEIAYNQDPGVPDISFSIADLEKIIHKAGIGFTYNTLKTNTQYGEETIIFMEKP